MRRVPEALLAGLLCLTLAVVLVPSVLEPGAVPCRRDLFDFVFPLKVVLHRALQAGEIPWWDPWTLGGRPFFADLHAQVLYPPNWVVAFTPPGWGLSLFLAFHVAFGGAGAFVLARSLGRTGPASLLAAAATCASGHAASLIELTNQSSTLAWLPWTALAALRFGQEPTLRRLAAWILASALSLLAGEPQVAVLSGVFSFALALAAAPKGPARVRLALLGLAVPLAVALATAVQVVPFLDLALRSDRLGTGSWQDGGRNALGRAEAEALLIAPTPERPNPAGGYLPSLFIGTLVAPLLLAGCLTPHRLRGVIVGATAISALLAASPHVPLLGDLLLRATPFLRYPLKYLSIGATCAPLLAAAGLDAALAAASRLARGTAASPGLASATRGAALLAPVLLAFDLSLAHHLLARSEPARTLLAPTPLITFLQEHTQAGGPRVHETPLTRETLTRRAALLAAGDSFGEARSRVERLEGGLPAVFGVHSTWGAASLTLREQAALLAAANGPLTAELTRALSARWLIDTGTRHLPLKGVSVEGGAARLYELDVAIPLADPVRFEGLSRAFGSRAPSSDPNWRQAPPGTWTYRPPWLALLAPVSGLMVLVLLAALALGGRVDLARCGG